MNKLINISWKHKVIFAAILAVGIVHTLVQLSFIQSENLRSAELTAQIETVEIKQPESQIIDIKPEEYEVRKVKVITIPEKISRRQTQISQPQTKKKIVRETRAARLRRAEKILTGI